MALMTLDTQFNVDIGRVLMPRKGGRLNRRQLIRQCASSKAMSCHVMRFQGVIDSGGVFGTERRVSLHLQLKHDHQSSPDLCTKTRMRPTSLNA